MYYDTAQLMSNGLTTIQPKGQCKLENHMSKNGCILRRKTTDRIGRSDLVVSLPRRAFSIHN
jgi:hypothetical protein